MLICPCGKIHLSSFTKIEMLGMTNIIYLKKEPTELQALEHIKQLCWSGTCNSKHILKCFWGIVSKSSVLWKAKYSVFQFTPNKWRDIGGGQQKAQASAGLGLGPWRHFDLSMGASVEEEEKQMQAFLIWLSEIEAEIMLLLL